MTNLNIGLSRPTCALRGCDCRNRSLCASSVQILDITTDFVGFQIYGVRTVAQLLYLHAHTSVFVLQAKR